MSPWQAAARIGEIPDRRCKVISLNGSNVAVFNLDGAYYALEDLCTPLGSDFSRGWLEGERGVCPGHLAVSSICTGAAVKAPACEGVRTFPVRVRDGIIEVHGERT